MESSQHTQTYKKVTTLATLSTSVIVRKPTRRLHNSETNWDTNRQTIQDKVSLSIKLKEHEDIKMETNNLLSLLQNAAKEATPKQRSPKKNKQHTLVAEKR